MYIQNLLGNDVTKDNYNSVKGENSCQMKSIIQYLKYNTAQTSILIDISNFQK